MDRATISRRVERGAAATIVAIFLMGGVLLGLSALTVDVGSIWYERRQLQNGADAAALSLLKECGKSTANCTSVNPTGNSALVTYTSGNVKDTYASIDQVCGRGYPNIAACPAVTGDATTQLSECLPLPSSMTSIAGANIPYVQVKAGTATASGNASTLLPGFFSRAIIGTDNPHLVACARAVFGAPSSTGATFPLTISVCEWHAATATGYAPSPPYSTPPITPNPTSQPPFEVLPFVTKISAHEAGNPATACGPSMYAPGGFGWLSDPDGGGDCKATYKSGDQVPGSTGAPPPTPCKKEAMEMWLGKEVLVPVFSTVVEQGGNATYTLAGVSSFYLAGWLNIPTAQDEGVYQPPVADYCGKGGTKKNCIWGWFTSPIVPVGAPNPSIPGFGPKTPGLIG